MDPTFFDHEWIETKALSMWYLVDMIIGKPTVLGCFWSWNNWPTWNTLNMKESIRNPWKSCWNALSMSINAPYTCKKMFQTVSTKQAETRDHTQVSSALDRDGLSMAGALVPTASGSQVDSCCSDFVCVCDQAFITHKRVVEMPCLCRSMHPARA